MSVSLGRERIEGGEANNMNDPIDLGDNDNNPFIKEGRNKSINLVASLLSSLSIPYSF